MDLLLTHGYYLVDDPRETCPYPPLGLMYLSSHLKRRGLDVEIFDTTFSTPDLLRARIAATRPPIVGIYGNLLTRRNVVAIARMAKAYGAMVVLGGPEPSSYAAEYLARGADVIVRGEGELTLEQLVPHLLARGVSGLDDIRGLAYLAGENRVVETPARPVIANLDDQPNPDRAALDMSRYLGAWRQHHGRSSISLITARGCAYQCTWCSHGVFGFTHRRRSPGHVAQEVEEIVATYRPDQLWYADDVFTVHRKWVIDYAAELKRRGIRLPFETITREDRLDEDMVRLLADMGCVRLWIGAESGSQPVLDAMKRRTSATRTRDMIRLLQRHGIEAGTFIMLGYDGETVADIEATVDHLKDAPPDRFLTTVAYPIKGTEYYRHVADRIVVPANWEASTERQQRVRGRRSMAFYRFAIRWMVSEVSLAKHCDGSLRGRVRRLRAYLNGRLGRLGMRVTRHQMETGVS
jgi:radical SAM superfamily enzyme YgiQ (UPF0313 family)